MAGGAGGVLDYTAARTPLGSLRRSPLRQRFKGAASFAAGAGEKGSGGGEEMKGGRKTGMEEKEGREREAKGGRVAPNF